jgi:lipopolysaccharide export system protein LptC
VVEVDRYSKTVAYLKVLLPLAALGLFSTIFLFSKPKSSNHDYVIPFTRDEIVHRLNRRQATTPLYFSTTANGHAVRINASQAYLGNGLTIPTAEKVTGQVDFIDGRIMTVSADKGTLENSNSLVTLSGNVVLNSADGITVQTEHLVANLAVLSAQSDVPVRASGAIGELTSGNMTITTRQSDGPLHMLFGNGVQLTYLP